MNLGVGLCLSDLQVKLWQRCARHGHNVKETAALDMPTVEPRYLSYSQAGVSCSCSRWTLHRAVRLGELTPCRVLGKSRGEAKG